MSFCENNAILAQYPEGIKVNPLRCKRWSCHFCAEKRKSRLRAEAYRGAPNTFITITVNPAIGKDPHERARSLVIAWRKIKRQACKGWKNERIPFLAVFEQTEEGEPHLHILARSKWIDQQWLSDRLKEEIGAPVCDIRRINSQKKAARYVSKYVGKDPEKFEGVKRYWRSLDYFVRPRKTFPDPIGQATRRWFERGTIPEILKKWQRIYYRVEIFETVPEQEIWLLDDIEKYKRPPPKTQLERKDINCQKELEFRG